MDKTERILKYAKKNNGIIRSLDLKKLDIHREYLNLAYKNNLLERVSRGFYILPEYFEDKLYIEQLLVTKLIYSHSTSAYYLGLTNRDPLIYNATLPRSYGTKKFKNSKIKIKYSPNIEIHNLGVLKIKNEYGNYIKIYNAEKTICDFIKNKKDIDANIFSEVLNNYFKRHKKDTKLLIEYAKIMKIEKEVRNYAEVLI